MALTGQRGRIVDYASSEVAPGTTVGWRVITRPLDQLELGARYDRNRFMGTAGESRRLTEAATQLFGTWHFNARWYALLTLQQYASARAFPGSNTCSSTSSLQFNWDLSRDLQLYWGVRSGAKRTDATATRGRDTEIYLKAAYTFRR